MCSGLKLLVVPSVARGLALTVYLVQGDLESFQRIYCFRNQSIQFFWSENLKGRDHLGNLGIEGWFKLK